jgi:plastocyanin
MLLSPRRLLVLIAAAALGGGAAQAVAATGPAHTAKKKAKRTGKPHRAVKVGTGTGWVPPGALGSRPPLTGSARTPAPGGGAPTGTTTTTPAGTPATTSPASTDPPSLQAVGVTLDDRGGYTALLSRASASAGAVVVQLVNQGEDPHNLRVVPTDHAGAAVDFPDTGPGQNTTRTLTLTAGTYRVFCTLTTPVNHEAAGMHATLTVAP